jgi:NadR type nicotinamide-nucleotide adenylyltransferase
MEEAFAPATSILEKRTELSILKVVVIGPESTGKSTLSEAIATQLHTVWVPEYARTYLQQLNRPYVATDLLQIAQGQIAEEEKMTSLAQQVLVCDTDLHVIKVWSEHKYGMCNGWILEQIAQRTYDLYLLTYIDIPWQDDPMREHPDEAMRLYFYHQYKDIVQQSGVPWVDIRGNETERLSIAMNSIEQLRNSKKVLPHE